MNKMARRLAQLGEAHESRYVESLRAQGLRVVDLRGSERRAVRGGARRRHARRDAERGRCRRAGGSPGRALVGFADVLRRVERPSALGSFSYEAHDAKLARETKAGTILQLSVYSELLSEIQGIEPEHFRVVTPLAIEPYRLADTAASVSAGSRSILRRSGGGLGGTPRLPTTRSRWRIARSAPGPRAAKRGVAPTTTSRSSPG